MKLLPIEKVWTGDGLGASDAVTLKQIKRTPPDAPHPAALYERWHKSGRLQGYETFIIKIVKAGTPQQGGGFVEEDYEVYPRFRSFGRIAWAPSSKAHAEKIYNNLVEGKRPCDVGNEVEDDDTDTADEPQTVNVIKVQKPTVDLTLPDGEFSTKELAEKNGVDYSIAYLFVKAGLAENKVKPTREERRAARGKATQLYAKT